MGQEVEADTLGDEWKGYVVRISGGNDKQGFPMKQGIMTNGRVRLLLSKGHSCYRPRRTGERKRLSVRGCIVDANLSVLNLVVVKEGKPEPKKPKTKAPKIQRLVTPQRLQRKRHITAQKRHRATKAKEEAVIYAKLLAKRHKEAKEKRHQEHMKRRRLSSLRESSSRTHEEE